MADTLFSHDLRLLTCQRCGAPLEVDVAGGTFACGYCGTQNQLARRDESADLAQAEASRSAAISEAERYARLREQDAQPPPLPADVAALADGNYLPERNVAAALELWKQLRTQVGAGAPFATSERLFHLTVLLVPHLDARQKRAFLETAIEILGDAGHRHVLRCLLARDAALSGDLESAGAWLKPCNPRPLDLAMDSAYRYAAATMATAQGAAPRVSELLGFSASDVPVHDAYELGIAILRAHMLELRGDWDGATREIHHALEKHGKAAIRRERRVLAPIRPAEQSFEAIVSRHDENERAQIEAGIASQKEHLARLELPLISGGQLGKMLTLGVLFGVILSCPWSCLVSPGLDVDPWGGAHAAVFCPVICEGCEGPYVQYTYSSGSGTQENDHHFVWCRDPGGLVDRWESDPGRLLAEELADDYELPGGGFSLYLTSVPCFIPLGFPVGLAFWVRGRNKRKRRAEELRARIAESERKLASVGSGG